MIFSGSMLICQGCIVISSRILSNGLESVKRPKTDYMASTSFKQAFTRTELREMFCSGTLGWKNSTEFDGRGARRWGKMGKPEAGIFVLEKVG